MRNFPSLLYGAPDLLLPGRAPIGDVEIDWNNPITDQLLYYQRDLHDGLSVNAVTGEAVTVSGTLPLAYTNAGLARDYTGSPNYTELAALNSFSGAWPLSFMCVFEPDSFAAANYQFSFGSSGSQPGLILYTVITTGLFRCYVKDANRTSTIAATLGGVNIVVGSWASSSSGFFYCFNGQTIEKVSANPTLAMTAQTWLVRSGRYTTVYGNSRILNSSLWGRALVDDECLSLIENWAQMLRPVGSRWVRPAAAVGGGTILPQMIQQGLYAGYGMAA